MVLGIVIGVAVLLPPQPKTFRLAFRPSGGSPKDTLICPPPSIAFRSLVFPTFLQVFILAMKQVIQALVDLIPSKVLARIPLTSLLSPLLEPFLAVRKTSSS